MFIWKREEDSTGQFSKLGGGGQASNTVAVVNKRSGWCMPVRIRLRVMGRNLNVG